MGVKVIDFQSVSPQGMKVASFQESTIRPDQGKALHLMAQGMEDVAATLGKIADKFTAAGALQQKTSEAKGAAADKYEDALTEYNLAKMTDTKGFSEAQMAQHNQRLAFLDNAAQKAKGQLDEATKRDNRAGLFGFSSENSWLSTRWKTETFRRKDDE